jgi:hypothetical protein
MDLFKNNVVSGIGLALTAAVLAPVVLPAMTRAGRPLAKSLVRGGMLMYEKGREAIAMASESVEDIMAEVRAEGKTATATAQPSVAPDSVPKSAAPPSQPPAYGGNGATRAGANGSGASVPEDIRSVHAGGV